MTVPWRDWAPAALTIAGLGLGLFAAIQETHFQRLTHRDAAAFVNGTPISQEDVERALASVGADRRAALTRSDRDKVLERLIEDEVLAQRAIALGLPETDPNARKVLIRGLIESLVATAPPPAESDLRRYFEANPDLFRSAEMFTVAGADSPVRGLPNTPMTLDKLKDYLGAAAESLAATPVGGTAGPFRFAGQTFRLRVTERQGGAIPSFDAAREAVQAQFIVVRDGQRLRSYLESLKRAAKIERVE